MHAQEKRNREIRNLFKKGSMTTELADMYGISVQRICQICKGLKGGQKVAMAERVKELRRLLKETSDLKKIASKIGVTKTYLISFMRKNNIKFPKGMEFATKKEWIVTSPSGKTQKVKGLMTFAKKMGWKKSVCRSYIYKSRGYNGYQFQRVE